MRAISGNMPRLSKKEQDKRLKLYNQGLNDKEIAKEIGICPANVYEWRKKNNLPTNYKRELTEEEDERRLELYNKGYSDREIGEIVGVSGDGIRYWRMSRNLKANNFYITSPKSKHKMRLIFYNEGFSDRQIAEKTGVKVSTITSWRRYRNLPCNIVYKDKEPHKTNKEKYKERIELYNKGLSDSEIAKKTGVTPEAISSWRERNNLDNKHKKIPLFIKYHNEILKLYNEGLNDGEIGKKLGITKSNVFAWRVKNNLESNYSKNIGNNPSYPKEVLINLYNTGANFSKIADTLGVTTDVISSNMLRIGLKSWKYGRKCPICGMLFVTKVYTQLRCSECIKFKRETYADIKAIRRDYYRLMNLNPEFAEEMRNSMIEEEGILFTEFMIGRTEEFRTFKSHGYKILEKYGGVLFEYEEGIRIGEGGVLSVNEDRQLKASLSNKLCKIHKFVQGSRDGFSFTVYYINPFRCIEELDKKFGTDKPYLEKMVQKIFKEHMNYILDEVENEDGQYYNWQTNVPVLNEIIGVRE